MGAAQSFTSGFPASAEVAVAISANSFSLRQSPERLRLNVPQMIFTRAATAGLQFDQL
jgi:hypothetical protein